MASYGNTSKIIDAEREQSDIVKRVGICVHCKTEVKTTMGNNTDLIRFYFNSYFMCPNCNRFKILMERV